MTTSAALPTLRELLRLLRDAKGSDLHLSESHPPMIRTAGELRAVAAPALDAVWMEATLSGLLTPEQRETLAQLGEVDFRFKVPGLAHHRANAFRTVSGLSLAVRPIPLEIPTPDALGLPPQIANLAMLESGLVLVTGATGSGKSTTMAALVNHANRTRAAHILTIEDPIEFVYGPGKSLVRQREVGTHTEGFAPALRAALREDPDVIVVGELRDPESTSLALEAAETGHLVFGTLHTPSAADTIERILHMFPAERAPLIRSSLAQSLEAVLSLNLVVRRDGAGRVLAMESLVATAAVRNMIRDGKTHQLMNVMQTGRAYGMRTMDDHLSELVEADLITAEAALTRARNRESFRNRHPELRERRAGALLTAGTTP